MVIRFSRNINKNSLPYTFTGYSSQNASVNIKAYFDSEKNVWRDRKWIISKMQAKEVYKCAKK